MSELQLTLIAIGGVLLLAVWGFNRFQEWRWHRMARTTLGTGRADVLLGEDPLGTPVQPLAAGRDPRDEPVFERRPSATPPLPGATEPPSGLVFTAPAALPEAGQGAAGEVEDLPFGAADPAQAGAAGWHDTLAEAVAADAQDPGPAQADAARPDGPGPGAGSPILDGEGLVQPPRDALLAPPDEEIEYLVTLGCTVPITGVALWQPLARAAAPLRGTRWLGRRVTDGNWCVVTPDSEQRFDSLRAALLLANRTGPVGELDLERFCSLVSAVATTLKLRVEFPPRAPALERAEALDAFCAEVDIVVGINVVLSAGQTVAAARIARWAESHGMLLGRDGAYHLRNAQGHTVWRLANRDPRPFSQAGIAQMTVSGVTFLLDVPLVDAANERLSPMFDAAATLARELGARVLDDNGSTLGPQQLGRIARELALLVERMREDGIPAGGLRARRLFAS